MADSSKISPEVLQILEAIEVLVVKKRLGRREFERRIKLSGGGLSRMLSGKAPLRTETLFAMLRVLGVKPLEFFTAVFAEDSPSEKSNDLYRKLQAAPLPDSRTPITVSREELKSIVTEIFTEVLAEVDSTELVPEAKTPRSLIKRRPRSLKPE
jgi:transcriptional regulator with XRE-family HTH domain